MYHCYFLINYIGPPKVFFLSFDPLFKKFAHHWSRQLHHITSEVKELTYTAAHARSLI